MRTASRRTPRLTQVRRLTAGAIRHPRSIRTLPRLARSYGHSTLELRLPWLPFDVIDLLDARVGRDTTVFEFGGGGSTAWFADRAGRVVTVEHDREWSRRLQTELANRACVEVRSTDGDLDAYVASIDTFPDRHFDVVVVDGRRRVECFVRAASKVKPGGVLVLDDADRERYEPALSTVDWPRRRFDGYAPCKDDVAHTLVFFSPGTCTEPLV